MFFLIYFRILQVIFSAIHHCATNQFGLIFEFSAFRDVIRNAELRPQWHRITQAVRNNSSLAAAATTTTTPPPAAAAAAATAAICIQKKGTATKMNTTRFALVWIHSNTFPFIHAKCDFLKPNYNMFVFLFHHAYSLHLMPLVPFCCSNWPPASKAVWSRSETGLKQVQNSIAVSAFPPLLALQWVAFFLSFFRLAKKNPYCYYGFYCYYYYYYCYYCYYYSSFSSSSYSYSYSNYRHDVFANCSCSY